MKFSYELSSTSFSIPLFGIFTVTVLSGVTKYFVYHILIKFCNLNERIIVNQILKKKSIAQNHFLSYSIISLSHNLLFARSKNESIILNVGLLHKNMSVDICEKVFKIKS